MTTLAVLIELGRQHDRALERTLTLAPDMQITCTGQAWRDLQDALAGHLLPLPEVKHLIHALAGMLLRHADHALSDNAESELSAASEVLSGAVFGIDVAIEHEQAAEAEREERRALFTAGLGVGFPVAAE